MRCIFLDRDGTLCVDKTYNNKVEELEIIGTESLRYNLHRLKRLGFYIVVISNQGGISLGYSTQDEVVRFNKELNRRLGYVIDEFFFCPHTSKDNCDCRKPRTKLLEIAVKKYRIEPELSWFIGDKNIDVMAGKRMGAKTILVLTGHGKEEARNVDSDFIAEDVNQALLIIERISTREIEPTYGRAGGVSLQGVIDRGIRGRFSKLFKEIEINGVMERGFLLEASLPVDFIIGRENP